MRFRLRLRANVSNMIQSRRACVLLRGFMNLYNHLSHKISPRICGRDKSLSDGHNKSFAVTYYPRLVNLTPSTPLLRRFI